MAPSKDSTYFIPPGLRYSSPGEDAPQTEAEAVTTDLVTADLDTIQQALTDSEAIRDETVVGPESRSIPIKSIDYRLVGNQAIRVRRYGYTRTSTPLSESWELATNRPGVFHFRYYQSPNALDSNRRPSGSLRGGWNGSEGYNARQYSFPVDVTHWRMPTVLTTDPYPTVRDYIGHANSVATSFAALTTRGYGGASSSSSLGVTFGAHEIWFRGLTSVPVKTPGGIRYVVDYYLDTTRAPGWVQQAIVQFGDGASGNHIVAFNSGPGFFSTIGIMDYVMTRDVSDLSGVLPVHDPTA